MTVGGASGYALRMEHAPERAVLLRAGDRLLLISSRGASAELDQVLPTIELGVGPPDDETSLALADPLAFALLTLLFGLAVGAIAAWGAATAERAALGVVLWLGIGLPLGGAALGLLAALVGFGGDAASVLMMPVAAFTVLLGTSVLVAPPTAVAVAAFGRTRRRAAWVAAVVAFVLAVSLPALYGSRIGNELLRKERSSIERLRLNRSRLAERLRSPGPAEGAA